MQKNKTRTISTLTIVAAVSYMLCVRFCPVLQQETAVLYLIWMLLNKLLCC